MKFTMTSLRLRERRVQLLTAGGVATVLALGALALRDERPPIARQARAEPKAIGALAVAPPHGGALKRFGWVPRDVLARSVVPVAYPTRPLALRRRALGGAGIPEQEAFAGPVVPIDALPMTADAQGLSGPGAGGAVGALPGPMFAGSGGASFAGGGGGGSGGGGSGGGAAGSGNTPPGEAGPTPTPAATPAPATDPVPTASTPAPNAPATAPGDVAVPLASLGAAYLPPSVATPMLAPPPEDWPSTIPDWFDTPDPILAAAPAQTPHADPITAVPEPSTWAMLLLGFALVGMAIRGSGRQRDPHRV